MSLEIEISKFSNLLEIARLSAINGEIYEKQEALIKLFRQHGLPFLATMPMRYRIHCEECKVESGDSIHYFENPRVPCSVDEADVMWGPPVGLWAQIKTKELHQILAHSVRPPLTLFKVLESVRS